MRRIADLRSPADHPDRGAVLIEAAIIMPLLLLVVFGILEYGLLFRTNLTLSESTRAGARVAVAQPRTPGYEMAAADAVSGSLASAGIPDNAIEELIIYKANPNTGNHVSGGAPESCTVTCYRFRWDGATQRFVVKSDSPDWPALSQSACGAESQTDYLGVFVRARHDFVSGFFADSQTLRERTVMRLEPLPLTDTCRPT